MQFVRVLVGAVLAAGITFGLFGLMTYLIHSNTKPPAEQEDTKIVDITLPQTTVEQRYQTPKVDKPIEPEVPPPDLPQTTTVTPDLDLNISIAAPTTGIDLKVAGGSQFTSGEYLPLVKVQPVYPRRALERGIEGYVIVEFTVTKTGQVRDPVVVEADPPRIFDSAAINAALKFKYKPRVVEGEPIEVPGVQNKITFALAK